MRRTTVSCLLLALAVVLMFGSPGWASGPVILMGIDAEDGGVGGHGPITAYQNVVNSMIPQTSVAATGLLVIGGTGGAGTNVQTFWNAVKAGVPGLTSITFVNGAAAISAASLLTGTTPNYKIIAIASDVFNTPSGGLLTLENDALALRAADLAAHVNSGGGLIGLSSDFGAVAGPYGYLGSVGAVTVTTGLNYSDITGTGAGMLIGIDSPLGNLDICCWHDVYLTWPSFLNILATNTGSGQVAALGGAQVTIPSAGRMTGGGSIGTTTVRHGFELHCDKNQLPNRLEVNWKDGSGKQHRFFLTTLTSATCSDDPAISPNPKAGFDTLVGAGTGDYDGASGATIKFTFTDAGEPGKNDTAKIEIKDAASSTVLTVSGTLSNGNQMAHK